MDFSEMFAMVHMYKTTFHKTVYPLVNHQNLINRIQYKMKNITHIYCMVNKDRDLWRIIRRQIKEEIFDAS